MSDAALNKVKELGGWDTYGNNWHNLIKGLINDKK